MKEGAPEDRLVGGRLGRLRERRLGRGARRGRRAKRGGCRIRVDIQSSIYPGLVLGKVLFWATFSSF